MDFKQLRSYVAIVDHRNFSKGAEKLNIAQSSVSTHLLQLEKELGTKLLLRTTKTIEVTDVGWAVYKYAMQILELSECVYQSFSGHSKRIFRIGASTIPAAYILPKVLQQYGALYPNDYFKISQCESKDVVDGVRSGLFDIGLVGERVQKDGLKVVPLCPNRMILIAPPTERYLRLQREGIGAVTLLKEPIILREAGSEKHADLYLNRMGIDKTGLKVVARVNDQETVKNMVAGGMGVSLISEIAARDFLKSRRLLQFDLPQYRDPQNICLIYPESCTSSDSVWNLIDYLLSLRL